MPESAVTIGVPTVNGARRLERCLRSIAWSTPAQRLGARVLVCDDGSTPEGLEATKQVAARFGHEVLVNGSRLGVATSWNRLARHGITADGSSVIVLLNDDVEVVPDWLDVLVYSVTQNSGVGVVGLPAYHGLLDDVAHRAPPPPSYYEAHLRRGRGMLASQGFCFAFTDEKYKLVGGFDERYFAFYEEVDFGVQLVRQGYLSFMASAPVVYHQGGATTSQPDFDSQAVLAESRSYFHAKNGSVGDLRTEADALRAPDLAQWNTGLRDLTE